MVKEYKNPQVNQSFWEHLDQLVKKCPITIDRPKGSAHPRFPQFVYPLDYGYLEGTTAIDGGGIDVWVGSLEPGNLEALAITVDLDQMDAEIKLLLGCTREEMDTVLNFLNGASMRAKLVDRDDPMVFLRSRRSIRRFQKRRIPEGMLRRILEAATWAPSAHNSQPWRFAAISSQIAKEALADAMGVDYKTDLLADGFSIGEADEQVARSRKRILEAPAAILLCQYISGDLTDSNSKREQAERLMEVQSVALAGGYLLLAAHAEGLGGVWMCAPLFAQETARRALELPINWQPQALILLGYPAKIPEKRSRSPYQEITRFL